MNGVFDIHMHLIPKVDDGSSSIEESLQMIKRAKEQGISSIIATPHNSAFIPNSNEVQRRFEMLKKAANNLDVNLYLGSEIFCDSAPRILNELSMSKCISLNGTRYILIEFDLYGVKFEDALYKIKNIASYGYRPIIAHAERYYYLTPMDIATLVKNGALVQINLYSLYKEPNLRVKEKAQNLVMNELVDFVGTDAHRITHRPPDAASGINYIYNMCRKEYAEKILHENAERLLGGKVNERTMA